MSWNYRVICTKYIESAEKHEFEGETYAIHTVYYDKDGNINGWCEIGAAPNGETIEELKHDIGLMLIALEKPILEIVLNEAGEEELVPH